MSGKVAGDVVSEKDSASARESDDKGAEPRVSLLHIMQDAIPKAKVLKSAVREARISTATGSRYVPKCTLDTGASHGNYIGRDALAKLEFVERHPCNHSARLGDGKTIVSINEYVEVEVQVFRSDTTLTDPITTHLYVVESLGEEMIIGLQDLLGNFFEIFSEVIEEAAEKVMPSRHVNETMQCFQRLFLDFDEELAREHPRHHRLKQLVSQARKKGSSYRNAKERILKDRASERILQSSASGVTTEIIQSAKYGWCYADDRVGAAVRAMEKCTEFMTHLPGSILDPWSLPPEECTEESETPDPLSVSEDVLHFMETSVEESRREYLEMVDSEHVPSAMREGAPEVIDVLRSELAQEVFAPSSWDGMKVPPVKLVVKGELPARMMPKARPVRRELYAAAKAEFDRLKKYFYVDSESPIASPLVIAPKATAPYIRFCGDYREMNERFSIPQQPIPIVQHELTKAARYKVFIDLDMANSFHQIPLDEETSDLLSVQTPWGLVKPKFLPEGVGPASGVLQHLVRDIFADFEDWTVVIFDNFLILADDHLDALEKFKKVLQRCKEKGIVLKMKKSWIGTEEVTFFGYKVRHGSWEMSGERKKAIDDIPFPMNTKDMQSFLGAALFFHHHIPDYSEWSARLYEMTHDGFNWDPGTWTFDYSDHFSKFKQALTNASTLYFPDYSLPWFIRCDASQYAVGAVLYQVWTSSSGEKVNQPIAFASKRFSKPATNWDAYKREAYGLYFAIHTFSFYLRGKFFTVETDHRNLQWIESSESPIVVRWRALMQSFSFLILHIPGRENRVADFMSRAGAPLALYGSLFSAIHLFSGSEQPIQPLATVAFPEYNCGSSRCETPDSAIETVGPSEKIEISQNVDNSILSLGNSTIETNLSPPIPFEWIMGQVHGKRNMHFGAYETWRRAKNLFPSAKITMEAVRIFVKECPMCQKMRDTGVRGLREEILTLKSPSYRRTVGIDHVTVTPADQNGNTCAIMIVEHWSHFPQAYPAKGYDEENVARCLFKHFCTFGAFDEVASDPGAAFMSKVMAQLCAWLPMRHKVSLIGRHESNGCEGSNKQFLRHLRTLVNDERVMHRWSDDTVLPLINFMMADYPSSETGGLTPFQLKYGSQDADRFRMPNGMEPGARCHHMFKLLSEDIAHLRALSQKLQDEIAAERQKESKHVPKFEFGDFVLWDPKETPCDIIGEKLEPRYWGPYEVLSQVKNDVTCVHVNLQTKHVFHVSRLKVFIGSKEEALEVAKLDKNQFNIVSINHFSGNPHRRKSLTFNITFEDGTVDRKYDADLAGSTQYQNYVEQRKYLFPLRYRTAVEASTAIAALNKTVIPSPEPGDVVFLDLRFFDGYGKEVSEWFDGLGLEDKERVHVTEARCTKRTAAGKRIVALLPVFNRLVTLTMFDITACVYTRDEIDEYGFCIVDAAFVDQHPVMWTLLDH